MSFAWAKDMSYFTLDVMSILNTRNGMKEQACHSDYDNTKFKERHNLCSKNVLKV